MTDTGLAISRTSSTSWVLRQGLVGRAALLACFESIVLRLYRYPAVDPASFREAVNDVIDERPHV